MFDFTEGFTENNYYNNNNNNNNNNNDYYGYKKLNEIIDNIGIILSVDSSISRKDKVIKILEKQPNDIKNAYLRYMFKDIGFKFKDSLKNEEFFTKLVYYIRILFGKANKRSNISYYGFDENNLNIDTHNKKKFIEYFFKR